MSAVGEAKFGPIPRRAPRQFMQHLSGLIYIMSSSRTIKNGRPEPSQRRDYRIGCTDKFPTVVNYST
eukprot:2956042-Karenia_brevis.AAC.1